LKEGGETWVPAPTRPGADRRGAQGPASVKEPRPEIGGPSTFERILFGSVGTGHLAIFCRQFAAYVNAGVDLIKSVDSLERQFARTALGPVLNRIGQSIRRGDALADAFAREPQAFDTLFLTMIRVAEARGGVPETLRNLSRHYEARQRLIRQARSAMIYPIIVIILALGVMMLLTYVVLPVLVGILEDMARGRSMSLPWPTRMLVGLSHFMAKMGWWAVPLILIGTFFGVAWTYRRPRGKAAIDDICLYVPVIGLLLRKIDTTRFARTLSSLLSAGVDYGASLDLTAGVLHLVPFRKAILGAKSLVLDGSELSEALNISRRFSPDVIAVVNSGEETGKLPESLEKLADDYEEQVSLMVKNLGSLIQPLIVIGLGGIVLFIALAFIMAYISILGNLAGGI
jgi:type II secretory pathway component PulF